MEILGVLVSYSTEENKRKLEDYIEERTGRHVDLGPIGYDGKLTIQTMDADLTHIGRSNITCAPYFPGPRFRDVDEFIRWHRNAEGRGYFKAYEEAKEHDDILALHYDKKTEKTSYISFEKHLEKDLEKYFKVMETKTKNKSYRLLISRINGNMIMCRMGNGHPWNIGWNPDDLEHFRTLIKEQDKYISEEEMMSDDEKKEYGFEVPDSLAQMIVERGLPLMKRTHDPEKEKGTYYVTIRARIPHKGTGNGK